MNGDSLKAVGRMERDCIAISAAELSERAFQRAGSAQQTSWPMLASQRSLFLKGIERQGLLKISGQCSDCFGLLDVPNLTESSIEQPSFGFVLRLPNASSRADEIGTIGASCLAVQFSRNAQGLGDIA